MEYLLFFLIGLLILAIASLFFRISFKIFKKLLVNALVGALAILLINFFGSPFGLNIELNFFSSLIVGIFGILGVIILLII